MREDGGKYIALQALSEQVLNNVYIGNYSPMLGDVGSGFWIGQQALHAAARAADGVQDSETTLLPKVLALIEKEKSEVSGSTLATTV